MWSVGVILYIMVIGRPPFGGTTIEDIYHNIKTNEYSTVGF
jgi:serine/threonine protein kinase